MTDPYAEFRLKLAQAGFSAPSTENMGCWQRLIPWDKATGRSFWIARLDQTWYVGAWGSYVYRFPNADRLLAFTTEFLTGTGTIGDFSTELKGEFGLLPLSEDEAECILPDGRPET